MDKLNRKITWVHVTYHYTGDIELLFATERWKKGKYKGKRTRSVWVKREKCVRLVCLLRVFGMSGNVRHTILAWDGYSVCYERLFS